MPGPIRLPTTESARVNKAKHSLGVLIRVEPNMGMLWQLVHSCETEIARHAKTEHHVHGCGFFLCFDWALTLAFDGSGSESESDLLSSGLCSDAIGLTGERHLGTFSDLRLFHSSSEDHTCTHPVHKQAGQVELWTLWHCAVEAVADNCKCQVKYVCHFSHIHSP